MVASAPRSELEHVIRAGVRADVQALIARSPGVSQGDVSQMVGYTRTSLNKYITGSNDMLLFVYLQIIDYFRDQEPDHPAVPLARAAATRDAGSFMTRLKSAAARPGAEPDQNPVKISVFDYLAAMRALRRVHPDHPALKLWEHLVRQGRLHPITAAPPRS